MLTSTTYLIYITISIFVTIFVARTLSKNGLAFLVDGFSGDRELAQSVNHLLVVGFYLINLGFVLLRMRTGTTVEDLEGSDRVPGLRSRLRPHVSGCRALLQHVRDPQVSAAIRLRRASSLP